MDDRASKIQQYIGDIQQKDFLNNVEKQDAVNTSICTLAEALKRVDQQLQKHGLADSEITTCAVKWKKLRRRLSHQFDYVNWSQVWRVVSAETG